MKNSNYVSLYNKHSEQDLIWQSDKSDFVLADEWNMELHDETDYQNAIDKFVHSNYIGRVVFEYNEITEFELSQTNTK